MRQPRLITKRELNQQTAQVLAGVRAGSPVLITERGMPRWRIEAIEPTLGDPVARLRAEGRIIPAAENPPAWPEDTDSRYTIAKIDALLTELRGDR
ncbi:MAG TPA: hypothetical protein PLL69_02650 [Gemmatimonadales bacterium]|nr:hypothetical protein [Gemmatimonadales bacterium]